MRIEIDKSERENAENILALAKAHNKDSFGARAVATNMQYDDFKQALLSEIANEPISFGTEMPTRNYSLARAIQGVA